MTNRPDCEACAAALKNPHAALIYGDCRGCVVRSVSRAPQAQRQRFYERLDRKDREQFAADVSAEHSRLLALRAAV